MNSADEQRVLQLIRQEIQKGNSASRFQLSLTNRHTHNGIDAPFIDNPVLSYVGIIITSGVQATLPAGWTIAKLGTGITQVTHNLNEIDQIVWIASPIGAGGATIPVPLITPGLNLVEFDWFDVSTTGAGAHVDTTFFFAGIQVNNKIDAPTKYVVN